MLDTLNRINVLEWLRPMWQHGAWLLKEDGRLHRAQDFIVIDSPWIYRNSADFYCDLNTLIFNEISLKQDKPFVPEHCQSCWKVVAQPRDILGLFALEKLQQELKYACKCGVETRLIMQERGIKYSGYFYHRNEADARSCLEKVRREVDRTKYLGPETEVFYKQACTEMEGLDFTVTDEQRHIESMVQAHIAYEPMVIETPPSQTWYIKKKWIEFAALNGDLRYLELTGGRELKPI